MVLGFKPRFKDRIILGQKIHTIREDKNNRWYPGVRIHFATGVRTRNYNQFHIGKCMSVQEIYISHSGEGGAPSVYVDGQKVTDVVRLAQNDGFHGIADFFEWFNEDFRGKLIHWTDFKY